MAENISEDIPMTALSSDRESQVTMEEGRESADPTNRDIESRVFFSSSENGLTHPVPHRHRSRTSLKGSAVRRRQNQTEASPSLGRLRDDARMPFASLLEEEDHITQIADDIVDGPLPKQINTLRDMLESLALKRRVKASLMRTESERTTPRPISLWKTIKYRGSMSWKKFKGTFGDAIYSLELWYGDLKTVEGHFGSGVATYFKFLRWLFLLNTIVFLICATFLVFPQMLIRFVENVAVNSTAYESAYNGNFSALSFETESSLLQTTVASPLTYKIDPYGVNEQFAFTDLFTGEGFFTQTSLYYGYYSNESLTLVEGFQYNIPNAYFFTMLFCYSLIFVTLSASIAHSYKTTFIETKIGQKNVYALKLFCGWDYSVATADAANLNRKRIYNELKELLDESRLYGKNVGWLVQCSTAIVQISLNLIVVLILAGTALLMWELLGQHLAYLTNNTLVGRSASGTMAMSIFISIISNVFPIGFSWVVKYEDYRSPRTALYVTLLRTFLLDTVVVGVLLVFWMKYSHRSWETSLGQEIYRLIIIDFFISVLGMSLVETIYSTIARRTNSKVPEFDIARNTLNLIYNQTLFWVGLFFSPLLSAVIVVKFFITFHVKKAGALYNCQPPSKSWRSAQTQTVFLILTFLSLLGVLIVFGYIVVSVPASQTGPFQKDKFMYEVVLEGIFKLDRDHWFWKLLIFVVKPGFVAFIIISMSVAVYYLRARSQAHEAMVSILRQMIIAEARDREFLIKTISKISRVYPRNASPAVSQRSFVHTPLSVRKNLRNDNGDAVANSSHISLPLPDGISRKLSNPDTKHIHIHWPTA